MPVYDSILEAIGNTPLVKLNRLAAGCEATVYVKVEGLNPGGSVKDRPALYMLEQAEAKGLIAPGGTIVEPTSGNTGVGLAQAAAVKGYRCIFVMPDKMSEEKVRLLKAYGAEVVIAPTNVAHDDPRSYYSVADRLTSEIPGAFQPNQFKNLDNPEAHYRSTGPEIWEATGGRITHFVAAMGTGGTISGAARYLKERNPGIVVVGADPEGSVYSGDTPKPYAVEGIGMTDVPPTADLALIDRFERVGDAEAFTMARALTRKEGLFAGGSSGAAVVAGLRVARELPAGAVVVVMMPSNGRSYLTKLYSDAWMRDMGFPVEEQPAHEGTLQAWLERKAVMQPLVTVAPADPLSRAAALMRLHGVSQLPVVDDSGSVGSIRETTLLRLAMEGVDPAGLTVAAVMDSPLPALPLDAPIAAAFDTLKTGVGAVLVMDERYPVGVLTPSDALQFLTAARAAR